MRTYTLITLLLSSVVFFGFTPVPSTTFTVDKIEATGSHIKIKIRNNCGHEVKYEYNGLHGSLSKNYYRELTIKPGHTLIIDGKDFADIKEADDKKEFIVCK